LDTGCGECGVTRDPKANGHNKTGIDVDSGRHLLPGLLIEAIREPTSILRDGTTSTVPYHFWLRAVGSN
jgi:hypothetical protein